MRRRLKAVFPGRLMRGLDRLDRAAGQITPFLAAIAIGLLMLNLICFVALKIVGLPNPQMPAIPTGVSVGLAGALDSPPGKEQN